MSQSRAHAPAPTTDPPAQALAQDAPAPAERPPLLGRRAVFLAAVGATAGAASVAVPAAAPPASAAAVVGDQSRVYYPEQFGFVPSAADHTKAMAAFFAALQKTGGRGILPPCEIRVTSTGIDYSGSAWPKQPLSGAPYGYPAISIEGYGRRVTTIRQIAGSTGDVFKVQGKTGADAGPAANNKATVSLTGFSITGTRTGRHGLYLRSLLHCRITDIELNSTGGAGVFFARAAFTAASDEYSYANVIEGLRVITAGTWGVDCDGVNAIDIVMRDTEIVNCAAGGIRIAPTNARFENTRVIGCGAGNKAARGFLAIPTSNASSMVSELGINGMRLEGNSGAGGYQLEIGAGVGATVVGYNIVTGGDLGAHGIGVGIVDQGGRLAQDTFVGRGTMFMTRASTRRSASSWWARSRATPASSARPSPTTPTRPSPRSSRTAASAASTASAARSPIRGRARRRRPDGRATAERKLVVESVDDPWQLLTCGTRHDCRPCCIGVAGVVALSVRPRPVGLRDGRVDVDELESLLCRFGSDQAVELDDELRDLVGRRHERSHGNGAPITDSLPQIREPVSRLLGGAPREQVVGAGLDDHRAALGRDRIDPRCQRRGGCSRQCFELPQVGIRERPCPYGLSPPGVSVVGVGVAEDGHEESGIGLDRVRAGYRCHGACVRRALELGLRQG